MIRTLVVWGAGRIGRGFVADIFRDPAWRIAFVDVDRALVEALRTRGAYSIVKATSEGVQVTRVQGGFTALHTSEREALERLFDEDMPLVDIAVHAPALPEVADALAPLIALRARSRPDSSLDFMMNVNMARPDEAFCALLGARLNSDPPAREYLARRVGFTGIAAMCISPPTPEALKADDPLALVNNGWPEQAIGKRALKGENPSLPRLRLSESVSAEEVRKLYTLNLLHAAASYLGLPMGLTTSLEAVAHPGLRPLLLAALDESIFGLTAEYGFDPAEMDSLKWRVVSLLENPHIVDQLERLGADSLRKLSESDRLVGAARLCLKHGGRPEAIARAICAGFFYEHDDAGTRAVRRAVREQGLAAAVQAVCGLPPSDALHSMILRATTTIL